MFGKLIDSVREEYAGAVVVSKSVLDYFPIRLVKSAII